MPDSADKGPPASTLVLRLSVPSRGELRGIVAEVAAKLAEYMGNARLQDAAGDLVDALAARVAPPNGDAEIAFEFHRREGALVIEAACNGRSSEVRYPLSA
jgi:hypothetical protein